MENNALMSLAGKACEINTTDNWYEGVILSLDGDWLEIDEDGEKKLLNVYQIESVTPVSADKETPEKSLFGKKKKKKDKEDLW